jgi:hypothetical protein
MFIEMINDNVNVEHQQKKNNNVIWNKHILWYITFLVYVIFW